MASKLVHFLRVKLMNHRQFIHSLKDVEYEYWDILCCERIRGRMLKRVYVMKPKIKNFQEIIVKAFHEPSNYEFVCDFAFALT
jgi:hypothetical protein